MISGAEETSMHEGGQAGIVCMVIECGVGRTCTAPVLNKSGT